MYKNVDPQKLHRKHPNNFLLSDDIEVVFSNSKGFYAQVKPVIHMGCALTVKTPPYLTTNIRNSEKVKVMIHSLKNGEQSEALDFKYHQEGESE